MKNAPKGTKVVCVNPDWGGSLNGKGATYTLNRDYEEGDEYVELKENGGAKYYYWRFEVVGDIDNIKGNTKDIIPAGTKVKCIDNDRAPIPLVKGKLYTLHDEYAKGKCHCIINSEKGNNYFTLSVDRFEVVSQDEKYYLHSLRNYGLVGPFSSEEAVLKHINEENYKKDSISLLKFVREIECKERVEWV